MVGLLHQVRGLDAFPKVEASQQQRSALGGVATVVVSFILSYLVWGEFNAYFVPIQRHEFLVDHSIHHRLAINFDVTFAMPCQFLSVDVLDATGTGQHLGLQAIKKIPTPFATTGATNLQEDRWLTRPGSLGVGQLIRASRNKLLGRSSSTQPRLDTGPSDGNQVKPEHQGCRVLGSVNVNKVAGNFHFTSLGHGHGGFVHTPHQAINFTHRIDRFSFGIDYPGLENPLDHHFQPAPVHMEGFYYLISVIPTIYSDTSGNTLVTNQYAVKDYHKAYSDDFPNGVPGVFFQYSIEPISVRVTEERQSLFAVLTRVCAAVGGVFVCVGLVQRLLDHALSWWKCSSSSQKSLL
ncbi:hypothetical protein H4R34_001721 [Dimargaris verticillata]|uniref:Endoplasmic reticulum vesicle transporter-domain-containing protein n=1 Tax=Dimargaris verticillata TaxID=2761393 RepID=A0A9W8B9F5_9FUNG|nr:hypothetical protein H4R34_001721 [Dimargaris verticillata]